MPGKKKIDKRISLRGYVPVPVKEASAHYVINKRGQVYSLHLNDFVTPDIRKHDQRAIVCLCNTGDMHTKRYVHRLVAAAFIPNPQNKRCVNHKDGNKLNNHASNLEWVTHSENMVHAVNNGLAGGWCKPVPVKDKKTGKRFVSIAAARKGLKIKGVQKKESKERLVRI